MAMIARSRRPFRSASVRPPPCFVAIFTSLVTNYDHHAKENYFEGATSETDITAAAAKSDTIGSQRNLWSTVKSWLAKLT